MTNIPEPTASSLADSGEPCYPCYGPGEPWEDDRSQVPATDDDTISIVDRAVDSLVIIRAPFALAVLPSISALISLAAEVESRLPDAVADARDSGYSWDAIAMRLATTTAATSRRYASYTRWRKTAERA